MSQLVAECICLSPSTQTGKLGEFMKGQFTEVEAGCVWEIKKRQCRAQGWQAQGAVTRRGGEEVAPGTQREL